MDPGEKLNLCVCVSTFLACSARTDEQMRHRGSLSNHEHMIKHYTSHRRAADFCREFVESAFDVWTAASRRGRDAPF